MIVFIDAKGGGLALLAASLARAAGLEARAVTTTAPVARPEIAAVLREIGAPEDVPVETGAADEGAEIASLPGAGSLSVALYDGPERTEFGPAELERLALARIARDRLERWVDARRAQPVADAAGPTTQSASQRRA